MGRITRTGAMPSMPGAPGAGVMFQSKEEFVAEYLREGILSGRIARGTHLKQIEVAAELSISVTPVRAAFRLLEAEGYLLGETHHGVIVAPFDVDASREVLELRMLLESRLVIKAMERFTPGQHSELLSIEREFEAAIERNEQSTVRA